MKFISENELDNWVRGNALLAQGLVVELVAKLVAVSSPKPRERRFPLADSVGQHGPDGHLDAVTSFDPFIPEGRSFWEIGTGEDAKKKANSDYKDLTKSVPKDVRLQSTFVFVTPLSGRKDWKHTWKEDGQITWVDDKKKENEWKDIRVIDGTKLIDWAHQFVPVELWLASKIRSLNENQLETLDQKWSLLTSIGEPPPLHSGLFLANRNDACLKLKEMLLSESTFKLKLTTHFPAEASGFVAAYVSSLDEETRRDISSKSVIVSGLDAWNNLCSNSENLILIAEPTLDLNGDGGVQLIQKARKKNHSVIYSGPKGGIPDPNSAVLQIPRGHHIEEELKKSGYKEERARVLAQQCDGNISTLLRCIQNLSAIPEWAQNTATGDLTILTLIGTWNEGANADKAAIEAIAGKPYGEWIASIRNLTSKASAPLTFRDGKWRLISRYEGWYALGNRISDEQLEKFRAAALTVLSAKDPKFELDKKDRYAASIYGKASPYSRFIKNGVADTLALLGSHSAALTNCSAGRSEYTASLIVRTLLTDKDWMSWASLNDVLPLLAEASPKEFLIAIEKELKKEKCVFEELFSQEGDGITGGSYMTGILWGLETLAWDPDYLLSATLCLGLLADLDPGGQWANRPNNSLKHIYLPWYPQTAANADKRYSAIKALLKEVPSVGWNLLLDLLPESHSASSGSRKPAWRNSIPDDWKHGVSNKEYGQQVLLYSELAVENAKGETKKIVQLIEHIEGLPKNFLQTLMTYVTSDDFAVLAEKEKSEVWNALMHVVSRHRRFADATWALPKEAIDLIAKAASVIIPESPLLLHQRLFSNRMFDTLEEKGDYHEQMREIEKRRQHAIMEIYSREGTNGVISFYKSIENPRMAGWSFGAAGPSEVDKVFLPKYLNSNDPIDLQYISAFASSRFHTHGWSHIDNLISIGWSDDDKAKLFSHLPFTTETWDRVTKHLNDNEVLYWKIANVNPYETKAGLEIGIQKLIKYERPNAAVDCLYKIVMQKEKIDSSLAIKALLKSVSSKESAHAMDTYHLVQVIKAVQLDASVDKKELFNVEWAYVAILNEHNDASPQIIEHELATSPEFFSEVIKIVFRSNKDSESEKQELDESKSAIANNAYRLLNNWSRVPGVQDDGNFDPNKFKNWLAAVKKITTESGHFEIAMTMIGHVFVHAPSDSELWIHSTIAEALNDPNAQDMRDGFRTALFNSRGVFYFTSGKDEADIATSYAKQAEAADAKGFARLGAMIRDLAESYQKQSERDADRDPYFDD